MKLMRKYSNTKIENLKKERKKGASIQKLMKEFSMPKTSVWNHIHNIKLPEKIKKEIRSRQGGSKKRSEKKWEEAKKQSLLLSKGRNKLFYTAVAMLYWAEGNKKGFVFTNTDGKMINFFIFILEYYFGIKREDIKITIRVFSNLNKKECIDYWAKILNTPKQRITVYMNDGGTKGKARFGICRLTLKNGGYYHKLIQSLIENFYLQIIPL